MKTHPERFWAKVNKTDGCWLWTARTFTKGYGQYTLNGKPRRAHRIAYELCIGPIPTGLTIDHVKDRGCTNKHCVNPAHLEAVTNRVNIQRGGDAQKTHCPQGHPYDEGNTYNDKRGRQCITCRRVRKQNNVRGVK